MKNIIQKLVSFAKEKKKSKKTKEKEEKKEKEVSEETSEETQEEKPAVDVRALLSAWLKKWNLELCCFKAKLTKRKQEKLSQAFWRLQN